MNRTRGPIQACFAIVLGCAFAVSGVALMAQKSNDKPNPQDCSKVPAYAKLKEALTAAVKQGQNANGGLGNQEWGTIVNRDGIVCSVVFTGPNRAAEWPGSRLISAEKANTANAFSTNNFALSSGNVYSAAQPGQSLYSIAQGPNPNVAFSGNPQDFGQQNDPMVGKPIGGVIVFGGGLPLYSKKGELVGALGVSGDTSCADHVIAWKTRHSLGLVRFRWALRRGPATISSSTFRMASAAVVTDIPPAKAESRAKTSSRS